MFAGNCLCLILIVRQSLKSYFQCHIDLCYMPSNIRQNFRRLPKFNHLDRSKWRKRKFYTEVIYWVCFTIYIFWCFLSKKILSIIVMSFITCFSQKKNSFIAFIFSYSFFMMQWNKRTKELKGVNRQIGGLNGIETKTLRIMCSHSFFSVCDAFQRASIFIGMLYCCQSSCFFTSCQFRMSMTVFNCFLELSVNACFNEGRKRRWGDLTTAKFLPKVDGLRQSSSLQQDSFPLRKSCFHNEAKNLQVARSVKSVGVMFVLKRCCCLVS